MSPARLRSCSRWPTDVTHIHPTAVVSPEAQLDEGVDIGPYCVVGPQVKLGRNTRLFSHVHIEGDTEIGRDNQIFPGAILGTAAQTKDREDIPSKLVIGDENLIREYVTIHKGMKAGSRTVIGSRTVLMTSSHVAHDCQVGDDVVMANLATLGGHVTVGSGAVIGGLCGVHQLVRVGRLAMVGGVSKLSADIAPFSMADGRPATYRGINVVGLRRVGMDSATRMRLKKALSMLLSGHVNLQTTLPNVERELGDTPEVREVIDFIRASKRGVARGLDENGPDEVV